MNNNTVTVTIVLRGENVPSAEIAENLNLFAQVDPEALRFWSVEDGVSAAARRAGAEPSVWSDAR